MADKKVVAHPTGGDSIVQKQFSHENSVSELVHRHRLGASIVDPTATRNPIWGDFTAVSFQEYQDGILRVQRHFNALPSRIRRQFANNPRQLFQLMDEVKAGDKSAIDLARKLDLLVEDPDFKKEEPKIDPSKLKPDEEANPNKKKD